MILNEGNSKHSNKKDKSDHFNHFYPNIVLEVIATAIRQEKKINEQWIAK